jgi:hypothetical protein
MNKKTMKNPKAEHDPCLCQGAGPLLSEWLRRLGPPGEARQHFEAAKLEFLKGLRALLDARIAQASRARAKGEKIEVE